MNPKELVAQFVEEKLEGDINRLATFPLGNLRNDKVYGCPGRNFDSDDTELMRAIYCLVFGEVWKNLSMDNLGDGKLRGDTLNTYNTLFSQPWNEKFTTIWNPDDRLKAKMKEFQTLLSEEERQRFWNLYNDYFYRRNNHFWYQEAMKKLPRLTQATRMLCCAEDLGMVPDCVPWVMNELRILSLEIQSMPKDPAVKFGHLSRNPYRSVCTISTHDMATLRQWWDEDEARTQEYYNTMLYRSGAAPHPLPGWLAKDIVSRHLTSPSMLCLLSLQDWLSLSEKYRLADANAERINIPANPRHYWRYRMHLTIEQLLQADDLNNELQELIVSSGRK